jgi:hypothetical protein
VLGIRLPSSWCRPRRDWGTPARFRRRAGEPPPCAAAFALSPAAPPAAGHLQETVAAGSLINGPD